MEPLGMSACDIYPLYRVRSARGVGGRIECCLLLSGQIGLRSQQINACEDASMLEFLEETFDVEKRSYRNVSMETEDGVLYRN